MLSLWSLCWVCSSPLPSGKRGAGSSICWRLQGRLLTQQGPSDIPKHNPRATTCQHMFTEMQHHKLSGLEGTLEVICSSLLVGTLRLSELFKSSFSECKRLSYDFSLNMLLKTRSIRAFPSSGDVRGGLTLVGPAGRGATRPDLRTQFFLSFTLQLRRWSPWLRQLLRGTWLFVCCLFP